MTDLFIIGTGGAAKEIIQLVEQINAVNRLFKINGFVDLASKAQTISFFDEEYPLFEESNFLENKKGVSVIVAHGLACFRAKIYKKFADFDFPNLIHPAVELHPSVKLGKGNIVKMGCLLTTDIGIGNNNYINRGVQVGHDVIVGNHNVLNPGSIISGGVKLADENNIGANATVLQYRKIGSENTLGAGAVLSNDVNNGKVLVGIPAKEKTK